LILVILFGIFVYSYYLSWWNGELISPPGYVIIGPNGINNVVDFFFLFVFFFLHIFLNKFFFLHIAVYFCSRLLFCSFLFINLLYASSIDVPLNKFTTGRVVFKSFTFMHFTLCILYFFARYYFFETINFKFSVLQKLFS